MHFVWAGAILGIAAVWGVPIVASILTSVLPDTAKPYLPSANVPGVTTSSVITALVYGVLLSLVLMALSAVGLRSRRA